jgi:hypothetical protein
MTTMRQARKAFRLHKRAVWHTFRSFARVEFLPGTVRGKLKRIVEVAR